MTQLKDILEFVGIILGVVSVPTFLVVIPIYVNNKYLKQKMKINIFFRALFFIILTIILSVVFCVIKYSDVPRDIAYIGTGVIPFTMYIYLLGYLTFKGKPINLSHIKFGEKKYRY